MGLFDKKNNRGHNASSQGFVATPKPKPTAPTAQSSTLTKLSRSAAKQEAKKQNELAKAALVEEREKLADVEARGSLSPWSQEQTDYRARKNNPKRKIFLDYFVMNCIDYNNEDENSPQVLKLKKNIELADRYDFLTAVLGNNGKENYKEIYDKFYLYLNATISGHSKYTMGPSTIMITGSPIDTLFVDIAQTLDETQERVEGRKHIKLYADGTYTRPNVDNPLQLKPEYAWVRNELELSELLITVAKANALEELKEKLAPNGASRAKYDFRRDFQNDIGPYLRKWTMSPTNNVFFDLVDGVIDIACSEV